MFIKMQKQEETCSHYRKWLSAMAECAKALTDSKAAVASAEADVKVIAAALMFCRMSFYFPCLLSLICNII